MFKGIKFAWYSSGSFSRETCIATSYLLSCKLNSFWKGVYYKRTEFSPRRIKFFTLRVTPDSILHKSTAGRYRPVRVADGPITARCRFIKNASWKPLFQIGTNNFESAVSLERMIFIFKGAGWKGRGVGRGGGGACGSIIDISPFLGLLCTVWACMGSISCNIFTFISQDMKHYASTW